MSSNFLKPEDQQVLCERFNSLLDYVKTNYTFYKQFYQSDNLTRIHSLTELQQFPLIDKKTPHISLLIDQVLAANPPAYFETSGTSGNPFPVIPDLAVERSKEFAAFIHEWLGLDQCPINRAIIALPFEMNPIGLKYFAALNQLGITAIPAGVKTHLCSLQKILDLLDRLQPELLIARPLETLRYAQAMQAQGKNPKKSSIKKIILTGEIISKAKFKRISEVYGDVTVHGVYGLTELDSGGLVSCSKHQYHLPSKPYIIVELLKDDFNSPVTQEGELGNIVLTNTHQNYMPLIRYKTGDFGKLQSNCGCEYETPVVNALGRASDLIHCPKTNKRVFPIEVEEILFQFPNISCDYQITLKDNLIGLRIELIDELDNIAINQLKDQLQSRILQTLGIEITKIEVFMPNRLADKYGIAKAKSGTLYILDGLNDKEAAEKLNINFNC